MLRVLPIVAGLALGVGLAAAADAEADDAKVRITRNDCERVVRHQAAADVAHAPGSGVRGRKFAPADLNGGFQIDLPSVFEFNVTRDVNYYLGKPKADAEAAQAAANAAAQAPAAADSAGTAATAAETLASQSQALVAIEDATAAVSALSDTRDAALAKYITNPESGRARRDYEDADFADQRPDVLCGGELLGGDDLGQFRRQHGIGRRRQRFRDQFNLDLGGERRHIGRIERAHRRRQRRRVGQFGNQGEPVGECFEQCPERRRPGCRDRRRRSGAGCADDLRRGGHRL
ncbi:MAG: hypothetical protein VW338_01900 [Rhodospirillaceae bacterium]